MDSFSRSEGGGAAATTTAPEPETDFEELHFQRGNVDFSFLLNRRDRNMRVYDFRVGNYQRKRDFFDGIARAHGLRKVFTVVERRDANNWRKVGFFREGAIPGYFRTVDACIMSRAYDAEGEAIAGGIAKPPITRHGYKKREPGDASALRLVRLTALADVARLVAELGAAVGYAPFRRGTLSPDVALRARSGRKEVWVSAETEPAYSHAKLDILTRLRDDTSIAMAQDTLSVLIRDLAGEDIAGVFGVVPDDDEPMTRAYAELGFKPSARLVEHVRRSDGTLVSAHVWCRGVKR